MPNVLEGPARTSISFSVAGAGVCIEAPEKVVDVLRAMLSAVPATEGPYAVSLSAHLSEEFWELLGPSGMRKLLDSKSSSTQVAGALVSSAIAEVAHANSLRTVRATVIEHEGAALVMIGADWESTVTIASHLHTRGWRHVSGDHALYDPLTNEVIGFQKALYVTSSSIEHLPVSYRAAIEASRWCVTRHGLSFYSVDASKVGNAKAWADRAQLRAVLLVDGRADELPALESFGPSDFANDRLERFCVSPERHAAAELTVGSYVETADLVERWFLSLA